MSATAEAAATDYRAIYDHVMVHNPAYANPATSPGYRACLMHAERLRGAGGPALDVGCGLGFVVELLAGPEFRIDARGVDVSPVAVERGNARIGEERLFVMEPGRIPFPDGRFALVTCFDVFEHLDEHDVRPLRDEIRRVLRPGGLMFCSVATRAASGVDFTGANLHRTVRDAAWWAEVLRADAYLVRRDPGEVLLWARRAR